MKKCFLFVAIACVLSVLSQAQVYNFPVRPGTETWSNLVTEEDRYADPGRPVGEYEYSRLGHHLYELSCLALFYCIQ